MELTLENVKYTFDNCIATEHSSDTVTVNGISANFKFNLKLVELYSSEIKDMLSQLPNTFKRSSGGGMSFLYSYKRENGEQWTGMQNIMEQLFVLGMAINIVSYLFPRTLWAALPGNVPYLIIEL